MAREEGSTRLKTQHNTAATYAVVPGITTLGRRVGMIERRWSGRRVGRD